MTTQQTHFEVALVRVPTETSNAELIGVSRNPRLAAVVSDAIREELEDSMSRLDLAGQEAAESSIST